MKKLFTLILTSLMLLLPLTAQEDVIPLTVEESEDISFEDMSDEEFDAYLETLADEMGISYDELIDILKTEDDTISFEDEDGAAVTTTGIEDDLSYMRLYTNEATGFDALIADSANLLSDKEKDALLEEISPITEWGNAAFYTSDINCGTSTSEVAADMYEQLFGREVSGTIFFLDMHNREIYIYSDGKVYDTVTDNYAQTITDNVYKLAGSGDYFACAAKAFGQIRTLLEGGKIAQPMKHVSNYLLALILALIFCYLYMKKSPKTESEKAQPKPTPVFKGTIDDINVNKGRLTSVVMSSSSGGGSRGGGGGGHSGGGGGHRF